MPRSKPSTAIHVPQKTGGGAIRHKTLNVIDDLTEDGLRMAPIDWIAARLVGDPFDSLQHIQV